MKFDSNKELINFLRKSGFQESNFSDIEVLCIHLKLNGKGFIHLKEKVKDRKIEIARNKKEEVLIKGGATEISKIIGEKHLFKTSIPPLKIGKKTFCFGEKTYIMGVINITPDSFYSGSRFPDVEKAIEKAISMVEGGADIIDIGGESTRPGASSVSAEEEMKRILPVIREIKKLTDVPISVDTYKSKVAEKAIENGADMINDISGLKFDRKMVDVIKKYKMPAVLMHTSGKPSVMQKRTKYKWLLGEISAYFLQTLKKLNSLSELTILDPGIGFGKTPEQNLYIIKHLEFLKIFGRPILIGPSRKSFIGYFGGGEKPEERLEGTIAVTSLLAYKGVDFVRVHDVKEIKKALSIVEALKGVEKRDVF